ncbi:MAG: hypothetical protein Q4P18_07350 [Methanobrevibacter sp.]|uniref:hypothetical protein n=1 Tax=Methanobrevibacter sp. TaxID=66852 RepID=UPI0026E0994D|nr:hypothetical protein [Methanobrevibacter sp.]MDO5849334.1 hypothetical protein [Methanobrevibacter sp.]
MNLEKTIENIEKTADSYIDPELVSTIVYDNYTLGTNDFNSLNEYGIQKDDSYAKKVLKVLEKENVFINLGMLTFAPVINECDIYSTEDCTIQLTAEEFEKYGHLKDKYFGILFSKNSQDYVIGVCDLCGCKIDACFRELEDTDDALIKKIKEIINDKII